MRAGLPTGMRGVALDCSAIGLRGDSSLVPVSSPAQDAGPGAAGAQVFLKRSEKF